MDAFNILSLELLIKSYGLKSAKAMNGNDAIKKANLQKCHSQKCNGFKLIFMDYQMPVMDGYEAAKTIRKLSNIPKSKTPIVAMTASVIKSEVDKCYESGMDDFISKPFEPEDLRQKILKYATTKNTLN
mgnify:CR=1 FL=1